MPKFVKIQTIEGHICYLNVNNIIDIQVTGICDIFCIIDNLSEHYNKYSISPDEFEKLKRELNLED